MTAKLPSYRTPPVIEVVYGVAFSPLAKMKAPHTGLFWSSIKDKFPIIEHAAPVGSIPRELDIANLPLPRIWFISKDENTLIQVQNNRFLFNWRVVRPGDKYPRFPAVDQGFRENFSRFAKFVADSDLGDLELRSYELTYINHIERHGRLRSLRNTSSLFPDLRWRSASRYLPTPSHLAWTVGFEFASRGRLVVELKPAQRKNDKQDIFVLELKAAGNAMTEGNEDPDAWFRQAREWIVRGFADLTSEKAQVELWGRE